MQDKRETEWIRRGSFERKVWFRPGYDCRQHCEHERKGDHGQHGDELLLAVRVASHILPLADPINSQFGLTLAVSTYVRDGTLSVYFADSQIARGYSLDTHHPYPTTADEIRVGAKSNSECGVLACGQCYSGYSGATAANLLWTPIDTEALGPGIFGPEIEHQVLHIRTELWQRLEEFLVKKQAEALTEKAALPVQCPTCAGHGVVPKA